MQVFLHLTIKLHMYSNPWTSPYTLLVCSSRSDAILKNYVEQRKPIKIFIFSSFLTMACEEFSALGFTKKNKSLSLRIPFLGQILCDAQITCYLQYLSISWAQIDFQTRRVYYVFHKLWKSFCYLSIECSKAQGARHCLLWIRTPMKLYIIKG